MVFETGFEDPDGGENQGRLVSVDENTLMNIATYETSDLYRFSMEFEWEDFEKSSSNTHYRGSGILAPRNQYQCIAS